MWESTQTHEKEEQCDTTMSYGVVYKRFFSRIQTKCIFSTIQLISEHIIYKVPIMWEVQGIVFGPARQEDITIKMWHNWIIRLHLIKAEVA